MGETDQDPDVGTGPFRWTGRQTPIERRTVGLLCRNFIYDNNRRYRCSPFLPDRPVSKWTTVPVDSFPH